MLVTKMIETHRQTGLAILFVCYSATVKEMKNKADVMGNFDDDEHLPGDDFSRITFFLHYLLLRSVKGDYSSRGVN